MHKKGFIYIPTACKNKAKQCDLHVVFHGCRQTIDHIQTQFIEKTGYLEVAEAFDIVILFPQAEKSEWEPLNPNGCWDFWGYNEFSGIEEGKEPEDKFYFETKKESRLLLFGELLVI